MLFAVIVTVVVFIAIIAWGVRSRAVGTETRQKNILDRMHSDTDQDIRKLDETTWIKRDVTADIDNPVLLAIVRFPPIRRLYELMLRAGYSGRVKNVLMVAVIIFLVCMVVSVKMQLGVLSPFVAIGGTWVLLWQYMKGKVRKRNNKFIDNFPDAIDIIVRSVRAGHPLNTALRMIAENSDPPVSSEFKQLVDEVAYGRTLVDALSRMSQRIDEPDLQFFIVVLSVQQETGSNLAEVLTNLSGIIRKRKQLRQKIKAMTSEGRATAYVLGALPVVVFGALMVVSPNYLNPLFHTSAGNMLLMTAVGLIVTAFLIVKQMINIEI